MPWPPPVTIATRPSSLFTGESIVAPLPQTELWRRNGFETDQGTRQGWPEDAHRGARQGLGREIAGQRRRLQPRAQRIPAHHLLDPHPQPPAPPPHDPPAPHPPPAPPPRHPPT